ncbi:MAG: SAM-dependent methyltransferase [Candidatus Lokiarchaeota archaeon]|nr:SAM-dependent methyltransferase [Candidatus Lokiarchaeota archaeon]
MDQKHLTYKEVTNLGCYYTPPLFVNKLLKMLNLEVIDFSNYTIIDSSCGYGSFFNFNYNTKPQRFIGGDIDESAIKIAKDKFPEIEFYNLNALQNINRINYNISESEKLIIVGNPPYNDITSKVKMNIKKGYLYHIDEDIKTRDLGISFILGYNKLNPDYVCILHPLSYLIKKANYELLSPFFNNYLIINSLIVNSQDFSETSKGTGFPIILALYKKEKKGTNFYQIMRQDFYTISDKKFNLKFDSIKNYIRKYPRKFIKYDGNSPLFWTMRDINALKRSKTFVKEFSENTIIIDLRKIEYYCYVDVFKDYIKNIPYYFGNCDVMIDNKEFLKIKDSFIARCLEKNPFLSKYFNGQKFKKDEREIYNYFKKLLGDNFVY